MVVVEGLVDLVVVDLVGVNGLVDLGGEETVVGVAGGVSNWWWVIA